MSDEEKSDTDKRVELIERQIAEVGTRQQTIGSQVLHGINQNQRILEHLADIGASMHQNGHALRSLADRVGLIDDRLAEGSNRFQELEGRISRLDRVVKNGLSKRRILLVEDDEPLARIVTRILDDCGAHVTAVTTYAAALEVVRVVKPAFELAIVDVVLPDGHGVELAKAIRARGMVVVLTSGYPAELFDRSAADAVWHKPIRVEAMRDDIMRLLQNADRHAETVPPPAPEPTYSGPIDGPPTVPAGRRTAEPPPPESPVPSTANESPDAKQRKG